jgi:uncharacterized membrane protein
MSSHIHARSRATSRLLSKLERRGVNVGNHERLASVLTGGSLVALGIARRGVPGTLLGLLGGALVYRGATGHCDVYQALGHSSAGADPGLRLRASVTVNAPPDELYRTWRTLEDLPRFMKHVKSVRRTAPLESRWMAVTPAGRTIEWSARITAEEEGRFLSWESLPGSDLVHRGFVRFRPAVGSRGTVVELEMRYEPLSGRPGAAIATLFGKGAELEMLEDLRCFKQLMEAGEIATNEGPSGRSPSEDRPGWRKRRVPLPEKVPASEPELAGVPS